MAKSTTTKRKRENGASSTATAPEEDPRLRDPYGLSMPPCRLADHQRTTKKKATVMIRNCSENPNCLYGLGEYHAGIWQAAKLRTRLLGEDPRALARGLYPSPSTPAYTAPTTESVRLAPCGLRNLGATCYLNSMLQCLFMNGPFRQAVYDWAPKPVGVGEQPIRQMRALQRLFAAMELGHQQVYDPQEFASTLALNSVMQQDAQEFSKLLLTHLRGIFTQSRIAAHCDLIDRLFQGQMSYVTKCLRCNQKSARPSSYYEISLNIKGHKTVEECLLSYLAAEVMEGENKYYCEDCNSKERAERYIEVDANKLPPVLTLQLLRFVYDAHAGKKKKLMDVIEVQETLNMTDLLRKCGCPSAFDASEDAVYKLSGYLNHRGKSAHVGHYTASVAYPSTDGTIDWYEFDDNIVNNMSFVVDTDGVHERHGKTIRSRDAYMLMYTRVDGPLLTTDTTGPNDECAVEMATSNADYRAEIKEYEQRVEKLDLRIRKRTEAYKKYFEQNDPFPASSSSPCYWIDTKWLASWVAGNEGVAERTPGIETNSDENSPPADGSEQKDDSEPIEAKSPAPEAATASVMDKSSLLVDENAIPFSRPMDIAQFCCQHSQEMKGQTPQNGLLQGCFSPDRVGQLKRISVQFFEYLKDTCGVATDSSCNGPSLGLVFASPSFRCGTCETAYQNRLLCEMSNLNEILLEIRLLKVNSSMPGRPTYLLSREWISAYKTHLIHEQKALQKAKGGSKQASSPAKSPFIAFEPGTPKVLQLALNEDIVCDHGRLTLDKKKYRAVSEETWLHFRHKNPIHYEFNEDTAEPCAVCEQVRAVTDEGYQNARAKRNEILQRAPLNRLYKRRNLNQSGSFMPSDIMAASQASSSRRKRVFLVDRDWIRSWREYIRDVDKASPAAMGADLLTCVHNKLLLPHNVRRVLTGSPVDCTSLEVEFVNEDEIAHLGELYGDPESAYYFVEEKAPGVLEWHRITLAEILMGQNAGTLCELNRENIKCRTCEDDSDRVFQDELQNFENRIVNVQLLADNQAVPTSETITEDTTSVGRRRSKRIKTGTGAMWPIPASSNDTVYVLKTRIFEEVDIYPARQRLYFRGEVLQDNRTLKDCGVKAGDAVFMRIIEDIPDELLILDEREEREVGFEDSVFLRRPTSSNSSSGVWVCPACTFVNDEADHVCEMCSSSKAIEID